ncbi:MAG: alanine racemase [Acidimicrobiia bacterium]
MRPSWVEIDLEAVRHNVSVIAAAVAPAELCAVVKADAYGHGDVPVARAALAGGATRLGVALVEEGRRLRDAGITDPVLLLSECEIGDAPAVVDFDLIPTVYRAPFVEAIAAAASAAGKEPYPIHVKVNTGMYRVGAEPDDAAALARFVAGHALLHLEGLWTHFAVAEEDAEYTKRQTAAFAALRDELLAGGIAPPLSHAANTAGALEFPEARFELVRVGLGIYGLRPAPHVGRDLDLRPAMRVVSRVTMVRRVAAGERPSYGRRREMRTGGTVATVPIGYADGVARRLSEVGGAVLIGGRRYPFAGTVTMDQIVVDVGDDAVAVGDEVVLLGTQGGEEISVDEWADLLGTINYEIVCDFGPRLPRRHLGVR